MAAKEAASLTWRGQETVQIAGDCVARGEPVVLRLPAEYHHALFVKLRPDAPRGTPEELDLQDGPGLLATIASIRGLEALAALVDPVSRAQVAVLIRSPDPEIGLLPGNT